MTNETVESLRKAIATYKDREQGFHDTILTLSNSLEAKTASTTRLLLRTDNLKREMSDMKRDIRELQTAVLDLATTQKQNTESRKKFEAGYWKRIGE